MRTGLKNHYSNHILIQNQPLCVITKLLPFKADKGHKHSSALPVANWKDLQRKSRVWCPPRTMASTTTLNPARLQFSGGCCPL